MKVQRNICKNYCPVALCLLVAAITYSTDFAPGLSCMKAWINLPQEKSYFDFKFRHQALKHHPKHDPKMIFFPHVISWTLNNILWLMLQLIIKHHKHILLLRFNSGKIRDNISFLQQLWGILLCSFSSIPLLLIHHKMLDQMAQL